MAEFNVQGKKLAIDEKGNAKLVPLDLTINTSQINEKIRQLENEVEEQTTRADDAVNKLQLLAEKSFERKKSELGCDDESITTPSQLMAWESGRKGTRGTPSGVAPLYGGQQSPPEIEGSDFSQPFEDQKSMFNWLHSKEKSGGQSGSKAKTILDEFTKRSLKALKETGKSTTFIQTENLKDEINARFRLKQKLAREAKEGDVELNE